MSKRKLNIGDKFLHHEDTEPYIVTGVDRKVTMKYPDGSEDTYNYSTIFKLITNPDWVYTPVYEVKLPEDLFHV